VDQGVVGHSEEPRLTTNEANAPHQLLEAAPPVKLLHDSKVLYSLVKYQPEVKPLHGMKVHVIIIALRSDFALHEFI
jgi:hypothetical protein